MSRFGLHGILLSNHEQYSSFASEAYERYECGSALLYVGSAQRQYVIDKYIIIFSGTPRIGDTSIDDLAAADCERAIGEDPISWLEQLRGAYNAVVVRRSDGKLWARSDRMGIERLYWSNAVDGALVFGSSLRELKQQLSTMGQPVTIDPQAIYSYLYFHMVPSPLSIYSGVAKLSCDKYLLAGAENVEVKSLPLRAFEETPGYSMSGGIDELHKVLDCAVAQCSDEGAGAFLSGGLDSSSVVGSMTRQFGSIDSYSMGFDAKEYDETPFARAAAESFASNHNVYYVTPDDVAEIVPLVAKEYDEPFGNSSAIPTFCCARFAASEGQNVLLAGDGGDELFAGNERYIKQRRFGYYANRSPFLRRILSSSIARLPSAVPLFRKAQSYISQAEVPLPDRLQSYNYLNRHAPDEVFEEQFLAQVDTGLPVELMRDRYFQPDRATDLNRMLFLDWQFTLADNDIRKVRTMCDLAGVDVRFPFLDDDMLDFSMQVPSKLKIKGSDLRHFYRRAMEGFLPESVLRKGKHGFGLPFGLWLRDHAVLRDLADQSLASLQGRGLFRPGFIEDTKRMHADVHAIYYGELVWILMMLELWLQEHE